MNEENAEYIALLNDKIEIDEKLVNENVELQNQVNYWKDL